MAVHLLPVLAVTFFVTTDGPSHLHNSFLISRLWSGEPLASHFLLLNPEPEPNWAGHFIMMLLNQFFSGNNSEKILVGLYVVLFPIAFRMFILKINSKALWASYLIFPFIYSFVLYIGFYNFCLGLPVLFFALSLRLTENFKWEWKSMAMLSLLMLLLYFCHLFVLALFLIIECMLMVRDFIPMKHVKPSETIKKGLWFLGSALPSLLLALNFILKKSSEQSDSSGLPFSELLDWLVIARPVITFSYGGELPAAILIAVGIGILVSGMVYVILKKKYSSAGNIWILFSLLLLVLYFFVPDNFATGGFMSMRLLMVFYLFLFAWMATAGLPSFLKMGSAALFLCVSIYFLQHHYRGSKALSKDAEEYFSVTKHIEENSVVLPLNYSGNWMHINLATYMGTTKNILLLDNYEANTPHFPTRWKPEMNPSRILGVAFGANPPCADTDKLEKEMRSRIDYITRWCFDPDTKDSCTGSINRKLDSSFKLIYVSPSGSAELFQRKK